MSNRTSFRLPDGETEVWIDTAGTAYVVGSGVATLARWTTDGTQTRVSPAMVNDERAQFGPVFRLQPLSLDVADPRSPFGSDGQHQDLTLAWASVYALWLHPDHRDDEVMAISVDSERVGEYMRCTGLGVMSPFSPNAIYWLYREAFWQGAGAPDSQHWLQSRPEVTSFPGFNGTLGVFASQLGFTRKGNVCTVHPVRPPKPKPGSVIYSRFIVELGQQLRILHIDAEDPVHFEAYKRWQNSDRVNASWQERGPDEHHRAYLAGQLADAHSMSCVFEWDGELAGYTELGWVKEDNAACFLGSNCNIVVGEHDQHSHILVGEEHFRGGKRYQAVATSIKHCCFLREPRTKQVIAEPRSDLAHVHIQNKYLPQEQKKRFHLPHKTAILFALQRDRFFQEAHLV
ncbi:acetyltransferase (GNAT) domain-containing protein [Hirsutella rhossiliensis]|uniref:Acetyltransferase (GNAT) domain-containing protein n=1 Tax=Hirsutella rhossiliensis TaxID=111463 RepID=A0A9P8N5T8_9HYPO|nr:acetyltransferase (GNAT) domain-containing protein [Hirsutella rhossiliensis]KAH0967132.1 acetyltransferase (GNAT) domain-containing protein [Hirsutella rhossiliensis]